MRPALRTLLVSLALVLFLAPAAAEAQSRTTSSIRGRVTTPQGLPIPAATVTARHDGTGAQRVTSTNQDGQFLILLLQPGGPYTLTVQNLGTRDYRQEGIQLQVGETAVVQVVLETEAIEIEGLEVEAERTEIFNPSQVGPATLLNERVVESIPILSRNIMELAVLSPLVKTTEGGGFSVAGQNDRYNSLLIDGVLNKDVFGLTSGGVPGGQAGGKLIPIDAISQYEILVAPFDVRLSGFTGGVMNAVTRSGTNQWFTRVVGVARDEVLIGDLSLPTGPVEASGVDRRLIGASVGGPIIRDRAHFFISTEFERRRQPPTGFNIFRDDPNLVRISPETVEQVSDLFQDQFGFDVGQPGPYPLTQEIANLFGRLDWSFEGGDRLTVRNITAWARNDESPNRSAFDRYEFASNAVFREALSNTTSLQYFSPLGERGANEFNLSLHYSSDQTDPATTFPQVEVDVLSQIGDATFGRSLRVGSQFFAQENDLTQLNARLTNLVTIPSGENNITLGVTGAFYDFEHQFLPGALGDYFFASQTDLAANAPQRFQRTMLAEGESPGIGFNVLEMGLLAQNQINAGDGLTMRFGIRVDVPWVLDSPEENPVIMEEFGFSTGNLPSGQFLLSPRWGFNWQSEGERTTQVRGGAGMFVGQIPFVWLSNAFHNNGLRSATFMCEGRITDDPPQGNTVPPLDPSGLPSACARGDFTALRTVTLFDPDFKYPQDLKFSATVDQELTRRLSGSLGFLFSKAINQVALEELNRGDPAGNMGPLEGYGGVEFRRFFGRPVSNGFAATREVPGYGQVLRAYNDTEDWTFSISAELRGQLNDALAFQGGYAFSRSWDRMSLVATDMISNYGFNPTSQDPNSPQVGRSNFDRPHKFVASIYGSPIPGWEDTQVSFLYTGQSGAPFSYVYLGDLNGDGFPGPGPAFDRTNDLLFVPNEPSEVPSGFGTQALMASALENDECLRNARGRTLQRNECRAPFQHRLDLRISHSVQWGGADIRLEGDMINVLNFVNDDWGRVESVRAVVPILEPFGRREVIGGVGELLSRWAGGALPNSDGDGLRAAEPFDVLSPDSQWQAQFGVRVTFGGER